jgi:hypothetical protein
MRPTTFPRPGSSVPAIEGWMTTPPEGSKRQLAGAGASFRREVPCRWAAVSVTDRRSALICLLQYS